MKKTIISALATAAVFGILLLMLANANDLNRSIGILLFGIVLLVISLLAGLLFLASHNLREIGQGILISGGLILLIGFAVCSTA